MGEGPGERSGRSVVPTGPAQPWLCQHRWAEGRAETGWQQPVALEQGPGRGARPKPPTAPGPDQGGPSTLTPALGLGPRLPPPPRPLSLGSRGHLQGEGRTRPFPAPASRLSCLWPAAEPGVRPRRPRPRRGDAALPAVRRPLHAPCHLPPQDHRRPGPGRGWCPVVADRRSRVRSLRSARGSRGRGLGGPGSQLQRPQPGPRLTTLSRSSSAPCGAHLDPSPRARSPWSPCLCLSPTPAPDPAAPTPRRGPCSPGPLSGNGAPPRGTGPPTPLSS